MLYDSNINVCMLYGAYILDEEYPIWPLEIYKLIIRQACITPTVNNSDDDQLQQAGPVDQLKHLIQKQTQHQAPINLQQPASRTNIITYNVSSPVQQK